MGSVPYVVGKGSIQLGNRFNHISIVYQYDWCVILILEYLVGCLVPLVPLVHII